MNNHLLSKIKELVKELEIDDKVVKETIEELKAELEDGEYSTESSEEEEEEVSDRDIKKLIPEVIDVNIDEKGFYSLKDVRIGEQNKIVSISK
jgi:Asp-tRNA(Asn)/Glu-tRNA(Gln) amidotransferase B subunit